MLSGKRAFQGATAVETMGAILKDDPPPIDISPILNRVVSHCLEKSPESRFQAIKDITFDLVGLSESIGATSLPAARLAAKKKPLRMILGVSTLVLVLAAALGYWAGALRPNHTKPFFHQLTFQQGAIDSALYAPGGETVIFAATLGDSPSQLYSARVESPTGVRPLGVHADRVLAISRRGEVVFLERLEGFGFGAVGTLANVPLGGGGARAILENVLSADWSPTKDDLAISHRVAGRFRLEYPVGKILHESTGYIDSVRFSPDGRQIAFLDHPVVGDNMGSVAIVNLSGQTRVLTREWGGIMSLAWAPLGEEIWFTAGDFASNPSLFAVSLRGKERLLSSVPGAIFIQSVLPNGRALAIHSTNRHVLMVSTPDHPDERDLSWLDWPLDAKFSSTGKEIVSNEQSAATRGNYSIYVRGTDGSPAMQVGDGFYAQVSPDGKWVVAANYPVPAQLVLYPLGPGEPQKLTNSKIAFGPVDWFSDSKRIAAVGHEKGVARTYVIDLTGNVRPLTPPGISGFLLKPDGQALLAHYPDGSIRLFPLNGGLPRPLSGLTSKDSEVRFSTDGRSLYVFTEDSPVLVRVWRIEIASGRRQLYKQIRPPDPSGVSYIGRFALSPDLRSYAYVYARRLSSLYEVEGMR
jgi:eukaryotic-like serine/threonine-protein kinase